MTKKEVNNMKQVGKYKFSCFNRTFLKKALRLMEDKNIVLTQKYYDDKLSGIAPRLEMTIYYDDEDEDFGVNLVYNGGIYDVNMHLYYNTDDFKLDIVDVSIGQGYKNTISKIYNGEIIIRPHDNDRFNEMMDFYDSLLPKIDESIKDSYLYNSILDYSKKKKVGK